MLRRIHQIMLMVVLLVTTVPSHVMAQGQPFGRWFSEGLAFADRQKESAVARLTKRRASAAHIGAVMAVLATFNVAKVLPPEHDPRANQLIHTLIQLQSALMKSQTPEFRGFVLKALKVKHGEHAETVLETLPQSGLTMDVLEAVVDYADSHPPWNRDELADGFKNFNIQQTDLALLRDILVKARVQMKAKGETLGEVFARRRLEMPGANR